MPFRRVNKMNVGTRIDAPIMPITNTNMANIAGNAVNADADKILSGTFSIWMYWYRYRPATERIPTVSGQARSLSQNSPLLNLVAYWSTLFGAVSLPTGEHFSSSMDV